MCPVSKDVIVIGAGLSGLSAAKLLREKGLTVLVLEARDRVGGRTYTIQNDKVKYVDLGGAYVGPTQNRLLRIAKEFGVETFLTNEVEDAVFYSKGRSKRFKSTFPPMGSLLAWLDMNNIFRLMDQMGKEIPLDAPWKAKHADEWDKMTMQQFCKENLWTKSANNFVKQFIQLNVTSEAYECSLLWFLWYVAQCGGTKRIFSTSNGGQERKFVGGSQQLSIKMAERIGNECVLLEHPVSRLIQRSDDVMVLDHKGEKFIGRYVIIAVPLPLQSKIIYEPPLPGLRNQLIQRIPMGSVIKTFMYYQSPFWRKKGLCGSAAIDDIHAPIGFTLDHVHHDGSHPALMGFILADKARNYISLSKEERKVKIAELYAKVFECEDALHPLHYEEKNWMEEQWSGGCYSTMMPPGFLTNFGRELRQPIGKLFFAGTETATFWSGYMEGAVQAGERAAKEIIVTDVVGFHFMKAWENPPGFPPMLARLTHLYAFINVTSLKILYTSGRISFEEILETDSEPDDEEVRARPFHHSLMEMNAPSIPDLLKIITIGTLLSTVGVCFIFYKKKK